MTRYAFAHLHNTEQKKCPCSPHATSLFAPGAEYQRLRAAVEETSQESDISGSKQLTN